MSTFGNPWSNPKSPFDTLKRRARKRARAAEKAGTPDRRQTDLDGNREYSARRQQTASAYQNHQSRKTWNDPFASATQRPSGLWTSYDKPSAHYDPSDW